jgi:hypothetical protein
MSGDHRRGLRLKDRKSLKFQSILTFSSFFSVAAQFVIFEGSSTGPQLARQQHRNAEDEITHTIPKGVD